MSVWEQVRFLTEAEKELNVPNSMYAEYITCITSNHVIVVFYRRKYSEKLSATTPIPSAMECNAR
jgi:hypothetical protein